MRTTPKARAPPYVVLLPLLGVTLLAGALLVDQGRSRALLQKGQVLYGAQAQTQQLTDYAIQHAPMGEDQMHEVRQGGDMGDEVIDMPIANGLHDDGDMHVPAEYMESYTFKQRRPLTSQLRSLDQTQAKYKLDKQRFRRAGKSSTHQLRAVIAGPPAIADPSDDAMYATKLQKLGVNVGSAPSQGGFSSQGDTFIHNDALEESYSLGAVPQREHNGNTIGGDFFGHVGDMPWTKEQIQAQARHTRAQALAVMPATGSSANGWCHCSKTARGQADCKCHGGQSKQARTMSLHMSCCQCGGGLSNAKHPWYVAPAQACALCESDCSQQVRIFAESSLLGVGRSKPATELA